MDARDKKTRQGVDKCRKVTGAIKDEIKKIDIGC